MNHSQTPPARDEKGLCDAIAQAPNDPEAYIALASWLRSHARPREAAQNYDAALALRPTDTLIAVKLAATLIECKELATAESLLQRLASTSPPTPGAFSEMGKLRFVQGRLEEAAIMLQKALQIEPRNAECYAFLGHVLATMDKKDQAMSLFQRAAQLDPRAAEPWRQMALLIQEGNENPSSRDMDKAEEYMKKACELAPDKPVFHCAFGDLLLGRGRFAEAAARYKLAREIDPGFPLAIAGIITALERLGDLRGAAEFAREALERYPSHPKIVQAYAPVSRHIGEEERAIQLLEDTLTQPDFTNHTRAELHFALGKLYDRLKRYPEAFKNFEQGNALSGFQFSREDETRRFKNLIEAFPPELQRKRPRASNKSRLPIFIVGMPRSGTTLTEQILASHPLVYGAGELIEMNHLCLTMHERLSLAQPFPQCMPMVTRKHLDTLAKAHLDKLGSMSHGMSRVTDKMPHNFATLGIIDLLFPGARVIHCRRDPIDNCLAIYTQHFNGGHGYATSLLDIGYYYRLYERMMRHWTEILQIPMLELRYEEMVADPERHIRELVAFCDLPWDDRCLNFHETKREVRTFSYDQVRQPIYKTSAGRWRNYSPFLAPLFEGLGIANPDTDAPYTGAQH